MSVATCFVCEKSTDLQRCSGCQLALYCSRECQAADRPSHKAFCRFKQSSPQSLSPTSLEIGSDQGRRFDAILDHAAAHMPDIRDVVIKADRETSNPFNIIPGTVLASLAEGDTLARLLTTRRLVSFAIKAGEDFKLVFEPQPQGLGRAMACLSSHQQTLLRLHLCGAYFLEEQTLVRGLPPSLRALFLDRIDLGATRHSLWPPTAIRALVNKLGTLRQLERLSLKFHSLTDNDLSFLASLPNLRSLNLDGRDPSLTPAAPTRSFTNRGLSAIAQACPNIQELSLLYNDDVNTQGVQTILEGCRRLRSLTIHADNVPCEDLRTLVTNSAPETMIVLNWLWKDGEVTSDGTNARLKAVIASGGRTLICCRALDFEDFIPSLPDACRERADAARGLLVDAMDRIKDPDVMNPWESLYE